MITEGVCSTGRRMFASRNAIGRTPKSNLLRDANGEWHARDKFIFIRQFS
jgi:hypothetical protein